MQSQACGGAPAAGGAVDTRASRSIRSTSASAKRTCLPIWRNGSLPARIMRRHFIFEQSQRAASSAWVSSVGAVSFDGAFVCMWHLSRPTIPSAQRTLAPYCKVPDKRLRNACTVLRRISRTLVTICTSSDYFSESSFLFRGVPPDVAFLVLSRTSLASRKRLSTNPPATIITPSVIAMS